MSRRLETATNVGVLLVAVFVATLLVVERVPHWRSSSNTSPERGPSTSATTPISTPIQGREANPMDPGPSVPMVERSSVAPDDLAATINDQAITVASLHGILEAQEFALESQRYSARRSALGQAIDRVLLDKEAARRGLTVRELLNREIEQKVAEPSPQELATLIKSNQQDTAATKLTADVKQARLQARRYTFMQQLWKANRIHILLDPPRVAVAEGDSASRGLATALVTIIEFSDFQCPFCKKSQELLRRLEKDNEGHVRVIFKHFPLPGHQNASRAAEAAECAGEQGRFWEMHDRLFGSSTLADADLTRFASELRLNGEQFSGCLDSAKYAWKWQRDKAAGEQFGVTATPTFFVNGRLMVGAPVEGLTALVREEIERRPSSSLAN